MALLVVAAAQMDNNAAKAGIRDVSLMLCV
jgi:hypothetical protein